jgi:hypothetical protein
VAYLLLIGAKRRTTFVALGYHGRGKPGVMRVDERLEAKSHRISGVKDVDETRPARK